MLSEAQQTWLDSVATKIPSLFNNIKAGNMISETVIGERVINGRTVVLKLVVEVVDPGRNPLSSHASVNFPSRK